MPNIEQSAHAAARSDDAMSADMEATLFVALELSLSSWVVAASAPGEDKASKHGVAACDGPGLLALLHRLQQRAEARRRRPVTIAVMQRLAATDFGSTACWRRMGCGALWSIRRRSR